MRGSITRGVAACCVLAASLAPSWRSASAHGTGEAHAATAVAPPLVRRTVDYAVPALQLTRDDGKQVSLRGEIDDGRPVVLNFIYTTCGSICPLASRTFSELQSRLGKGSGSVHLVSISIDPEEDTPAQLRAYAMQYGAGAGWQHYTGTPEASVAAQRAFDVYRGDKMSHTAVTLVRLSPRERWVRLEGFATADQLLAELRQSVASR